MIITIDGPAASGKSTVAKRLAQRLKVPYLETGIIYRAVGYLLSTRGVQNPDEKQALELLDELEIEPSPEGTKVLWKGKKLGSELYTEEVGRLASRVATLPRFREKVNETFRELLKGKSAVVEGRDAGTYIFPDAPLKFFITASPQERAKRRYRQLVNQGKDADYEEILKAIMERDERDRNRPKYPFRPAPDAVVIDTTHKEAKEVLEEVLERLNEASS